MSSRILLHVSLLVLSVWVHQRTAMGSAQDVIDNQSAHRGACPSDWTFVQEMASCFRSVSSPRRTSGYTWDEAKGECERIGAHLPNLRTEAESSAFFKSGRFGLTSLWLGLRRVGQDFKWVPGLSNPDFTNFQCSNNTDGDCVAYSAGRNSSSWRWQKRSCTERLNVSTVVCQKGEASFISLSR